MTVERTAAAFDFDGTLLSGDSLLGFLWCAAPPVRRPWALAVTAAALAGYGARLVSNDRTKRALCASWLAGASLEDATTAAEAYGARLDARLRPEAWRRLTWHRQRGDEVLIVSASLELYLRPWAARHGLHHVIGTRLAVHEGRLTGALLGPNCWGPEKVRRLGAHPARIGRALWAYGDSRGDQEMLAAADRPFHRRFEGGADV